MTMGKWTIRVISHIDIFNEIMGNDMRFPTIWTFDKCRRIRACAASFKL